MRCSRHRDERDAGARGEKDLRPGRPYVRDATPSARAALAAPQTPVALALLSLATSLLVGLVAWGALTLSDRLIELVWGLAGGRGADPALGASCAPRWFPLPVCVAGGLVIGLWTRRTHVAPESLETVMATLRRTGSYRLEHPSASVVSFLLPLAFGGSVGPEAGLTGLIASGCCWIRDTLKRAGLRVGAVADVTVSASLSAIFGAPFAGLLAEAEGDAGAPDVDAYEMRRPVKALLYLTAALGALAGVRLLSALVGGASGLPRFAASEADLADLAWFLPCAGMGYALALVSRVSRAVATLDIGLLSGDRRSDRAAVGIRLQDVSGGEIASDLIEITNQTVLTSTVVVETEIVPVREVPLAVATLVSGTPAEGYELVEIVPAQESMLVAADDEVLAAITELTTDQPLSIEGATQDVTGSVRLRRPAGIENTMPYDVTVTARIQEKTVQRTLRQVQVEVDGLDDSLRATLSREKQTVQLTGLYTFIEGLSQSDVRLFVDVNGLGEGTHVVPVQISIDNAPEFACALSSPEVTVTIRQR